MRKSGGAVPADGIDKEIGMNCEWETELQFCFPNPYFREVLKILSEEGKTLVAASDMYLERKKVEKLLEKNGILVFRQVFVSRKREAPSRKGRSTKGSGRNTGRRSGTPCG